MSTAFLKKYGLIYDQIYQDKNYEKECRDLVEIFNLCATKKPKRILDLACGTGNHAYILASKGYEVVGVDSSRYMIEAAKAKHKGESVSFEVRGMADVNYYEEYDVVISMFAALPYLLKRDDLKEVFTKVWKALIPGGLFIFDLWNGLVVPFKFSPSVVKEIKSDDRRIIRFSKIEIDPVNQLAINKFRIMVLEKDRIVDEFEETHRTRFYTVTEIRDLLSEVKFHQIKHFPLGRFGKQITLDDWDVQFVAVK